MPALVVLDDLHLLCPAPSQAPEAALSNIGSAALVAWLRDVLREYHARPDGRPPLPGMPWPHLWHIKKDSRHLHDSTDSSHADQGTDLGGDKQDRCRRFWQSL